MVAGLCVAIPVYYATGNRLRAFMWAFLSGITEIFGGLVGYAALGNGLVSYRQSHVRYVYTCEQLLGEHA